MKNWDLGAFEEVVLMAIGILGEGAYGVTIKEELEKHTRKKPSVGALHSALYRLENKGYVVSHESGATAERGGRRKRFYEMTASGKEVLVKTHEFRTNMLDLIPGLDLGDSPS